MCVSYCTGGRPDTPDYQRYLPWFLIARPSEACAKGGAGAHSDLIARVGGPDAPAGGPDAAIAGLDTRGVVSMSAFRTFYTALNEQSVRAVIHRSTRVR